MVIRDLQGEGIIIDFHCQFEVYLKGIWISTILAAFAVLFYGYRISPMIDGQPGLIVLLFLSISDMAATWKILAVQWLWRGLNIWLELYLFVL